MLLEPEQKQTQKTRFFIKRPDEYLGVTGYNAIVEGTDYHETCPHSDEKGPCFRAIQPESALKFQKDCFHLIYWIEIPEILTFGPAREFLELSDHSTIYQRWFRQLTPTKQQEQRDILNPLPYVFKKGKLRFFYF